LTVARLVLLDSGPLGMASDNPSKLHVNRVLAWIAALDAAGTDVVVPEIADYEIRRELIRAGKTAGIVRLDDLEQDLIYLPLTTDSMRRAAEFWGIVRNLGLATAHPAALDGDAILAGQAAVAGFPGDEVIIATTNIRHLGRFPGIDARPWQSIR
jgi:predicted nucleic acid-binding protein